VSVAVVTGSAGSNAKLATSPTETVAVLVCETVWPLCANSARIEYV